MAIQSSEKSRNELLLPKKNSWVTEDSIRVTPIPLPRIWTLSGMVCEFAILKVPGASLINIGASAVGASEEAFEIAASTVLN